jgi:methylated-DNA-[protein]-cysteine S-methyltransferase
MLMFSLSEYVTDQGSGAVEATVLGICRVWLPGDQLPDMSGRNASLFSDKAARQLESYFKGALQQFDLPVDISCLTQFRRHVLQLTMQIPYGLVITYGALAAQAGSPGAARAVGGSLAANPVPVVIPCHRVVAASGTLTGYSGAGGIVMKKNLLSMEGVDFRNIKKN